MHLQVEPWRAVLLVREQPVLLLRPLPILITRPGCTPRLVCRLLLPVVVQQHRGVERKSKCNTGLDSIRSKSQHVPSRKRSLQAAILRTCSLCTADIA